MVGLLVLGVWLLGSLEVLGVVTVGSTGDGPFIARILSTGNDMSFPALCKIRLDPAYASTL